MSNLSPHIKEIGKSVNHDQVDALRFRGAQRPRQPGWLAAHREQPGSRPPAGPPTCTPSPAGRYRARRPSGPPAQQQPQASAQASSCRFRPSVRREQSLSLCLVYHMVTWLTSTTRLLTCGAPRDQPGRRRETILRSLVDLAGDLAAGVCELDLDTLDCRAATGLRPRRLNGFSGSGMQGATRVRLAARRQSVRSSFLRREDRAVCARSRCPARRRDSPTCGLRCHPAERPGRCRT